MPAGKPFIRRVSDLLRLPATSSPKAHLLLNAGYRSDISWRCLFLPHWNGRSFLPPQATTPHAKVTSDASGTWSCGASAGSDWFQLQWPPAWGAVDITAKELLPILIALAIWGKSWSGHTVLIRTDNMAVVHILRAGSARNEMVMHLLCSLFFILAIWSLALTPQHFPGCHNDMADALSSNRLPLFHSLAPHMSPYPSPVHSSLQDILINQPQDWTNPQWLTQFITTLQTAYSLPQNTHTPLVKNSSTPFAPVIIYPLYQLQSSYFVVSRLNSLTTA